MKNVIYIIILIFICILFTTGSYAHDPNVTVYWHLNPDIKSCSIELDPELTQGEFRKFSRQAGLIGVSRAMASAETLGKGNCNFGLEYSNTPVSQHDNAWINTFTHPDADCPLGDSIKVPLLRLKYGINDNMDIGTAFTKALDANYGFLNMEFKYSFLKESNKSPAAALRASTTILLGVADMDMNIFSLDCSISKKVYGITPYLGLRENLIIAKEKTSKVDLSSETLWPAQGYIGIEYKVKKFAFAVEYNIADVNTAGILISYTF